MRVLLDIFANWPMPALWLLFAGTLLIRRRVGRVLMGLAVLVLFVGSLPATAKALLIPLVNSAPRYGSPQADGQQAHAVAIVVLLGGAFVDPAGRWWPLPGSVRRAVLGHQLQQATDLPIILSGGAPLPGQVPETEVVAGSIPLPSDKTILESASHDTYESGRAVARILAERFPEAEHPHVILVTDPSHVARASAVLRRFDAEPIAAPVAARWPDDMRPNLRLSDFVPSGRGLGAVRGAWREYVGIAWYLLSGRVRWADL